MKDVVSKGRTLEEATDNALQALGARREEVEIEPLSTGSKGFLGFGRKPAEVRASLRAEDRILASVFLRNIMRFMKMDTPLEVKEQEDELVISLGKDATSLIGARGQTLDAMQYLLARFMGEENDDRRKVVIDIDNYRDQREDDLRAMAERLASKVISTKQDARTEPLSAQERRVIHITLKENPDVTTFSIGEGQRKRVVIASNDKDAVSSSGRSRPQRRGRSGGGGGGGGPKSSGGGGQSRNRGGRGGRGGGRRRRGGRPQGQAREAS